MSEDEWLIYYYEQRNKMRGPGRMNWVPRICHDYPPLIKKDDPPIRGLREIKSSEHKGWTLNDFQAAYGVASNGEGEHKGDIQPSLRNDQDG